MKVNKNINVLSLKIWLITMITLVSLIVFVGGLTRLTESGLSITVWEVFKGVFPPLNLQEWNNYFSEYKKIPEYKLLNTEMSLDEFKIIFYWEYSHRMLARVIGLISIIPLIYFSITYKGFLNNYKRYFILFLLIVFQGFIGWYMVKSGLTERTDVSHYRLSLHLTLAFVIFILLLWNYFKYKNQQIFIRNKKLPSYLLIFFTFCILVQISIGAFVSGLDAGQIYQSWPLMNHGYFPDDSIPKDLFSMKAFDTPSIVQFIHRNVAYFIILLFSCIAAIIYRNEDFIYLRKTTLLVFMSLFLQTFLGILTVLSGAQIILASMHQIGSILLITTSLILVFKNSRIN